MAENNFILVYRIPVDSFTQGVELAAELQNIAGIEPVFIEDPEGNQVPVELP